MTVQTHLADWLEGIGADGLMDDNGVRQYSTFALRYQSIALVDGPFLDLVPHYAPKEEDR